MLDKLLTKIKRVRNLGRLMYVFVGLYLKTCFQKFSSTRMRFFCFTVILVPRARDPFLVQTKRIVGSGNENVSLKLETDRKLF